jgi:hypothetical protein
VVAAEPLVIAIEIAIKDIEVVRVKDEKDFNFTGGIE